ncbi:alkene reductase [Methylophaga sp.]|uniref:alkene reductase n=1 Tax=Methylophaga sp. TaxID=2024840 RepID=UPI003F69BA5F
MNESSKQSFDLISPLQIGALTLKNRFIMAPLTRNRAGEGLVPTDMMVEYYRQRASAGLIITEATLVTEEGIGYPNIPGIYSQEQIEGWKKVTEAVHESGGKIFMQIWHCGRVGHSSMIPNSQLPLAPSAIKPAGDVMTYEGMKPYETPKEMSTNDITKVIEQFRQGAYNALSAGFDGIEVHGANGYLLDQFLRDGSNKRTDAYGGSLENRARLLLQVIDEVCKIWGPDRVGVRLSPLQPFNDISDSHPAETFSYVVKQLNKYGLAYLHITEMGTDSPGAAGPEFDISSLRPLWGGTYISNFNYSLETANKAIQNGEVDAIAFGKLFIANPDLPVRFIKQAPLNEPEPSTFYGGDERGYIDYPFLEA